MNAYKLVENKFSELFMAEQNLSRLASEATGIDMTADMCGDGEIEFRLNDENDMPISDSCIRIEDVLEMINKCKK